MAKQGNYVAVPGGSGPNPFKGVSDSLADLSKMYTDRETVSREEALARDKLANEQERWDITNQRQQTTADRATKAYNTKQAMNAWYKGFGDKYNLDDLSREKAKKDFGLTDEHLNSSIGRDILNEVQKTIYQEDIEKRYGNDFTKQFGEAFDPSVVKSIYGDRNSLSALQAAEAEDAKRRFETAKFFVGKRIDAAGKLDPTGTAGTSKKGTSKIPKTYNDIHIADMVKDFDTDDWFVFDSEKQDAQDVAKSTLGVFEKMQNPDKTQKYNAAQAKVMTEFVLDRLRDGSDLKSIDDAKKKIAGLIVDAQDGMTNSYKTGYTGSGGRKGNTTAREYLESALSTDLDPNAFNPRNVRTIRKTAAQQAIDKLLGRTTKTKKAVKTERPVTSGQNARWPLNKPLNNPPTTASDKQLPAPEAQKVEELIKDVKDVTRRNRFAGSFGGTPRDLPMTSKADTEAIAKYERDKTRKDAVQDLTEMQKDLEAYRAIPPGEATMISNIGRAILEGRIGRAKVNLKRIDQTR